MTGLARPPTCWAGGTPPGHAGSACPSCSTVSHSNLAALYLNQTVKGAAQKYRVSPRAGPPCLFARPPCARALHVHAQRRLLRCAASCGATTPNARFGFLGNLRIQRQDFVQQIFAPCLHRRDAILRGHRRTRVA